jgi:hypothetical protein
MPTTTVEKVSFDGASWESRPDAPYAGIWKVWFFWAEYNG